MQVDSLPDLLAREIENAGTGFYPYDQLFARQGEAFFVESADGGQKSIKLSVALKNQAPGTHNMQSPDKLAVVAIIDSTADTAVNLTTAVKESYTAYGQVENYWAYCCCLGGGSLGGGGC